jgi:N-methylhydantoinase B
VAGDRATTSITRDADANQDALEGYDPITLSVVLGRLDGIVREMSLTLERTAWTSIIAICKDFSCALYDADRRQLSMHDAVPVHTTSMYLVLDAIADRYSGSVRPGDVYVCNDPYHGNTHIGDLVTACPVFVEGQHRFWSVAKGHQLDTGAYVPSSISAVTENVWQEGITIPPARLVKEGEWNAELRDMYLANVRYRELLEGDLRAQLAAIEKGRQRLVELCAEFGLAETIRYADECIRYADRRMSAAIRDMPDGTYRGEGWIDTDGFDTLDMRVGVTVTIADDQITVDLTDSAPQGKGGMNGSLASARAAGSSPFLYYVPADIPHNQGCLDHITVRTRAGTVCHAAYPASTSVSTNCPSDVIQDAIHKAMSTAVPDVVPAGGPKDANLPQLSGVDGDGRPWGTMIFNGSGGGGACKGVDGWPIFESISGAGALRIQQVEEIELLFPLEVEQVEIEPDSCGWGEWIGGPGTRMVVRPLTSGDTECIMFGDGMFNPPHGVLGGLPGSGGGVFIEQEGNPQRVFLGACAVAALHAGDVWVSISSGGGGYGRPECRPADQVANDVRDGVMSRATARSVFGVALLEDGEIEPLVDEAATAREREQLRMVERASVDPTTPHASTWLEDHASPADRFARNGD